MISRPIPLTPVGKDYIWGGVRLKKEYRKKKIACTPLAETWECSVHPDGQSIVRAGKYKGCTLASVLEGNPQFLGTKTLEKGDNTLPIMIKLIDAAQNLSVQVHPNDEYALKVEHERGKTEMWYVLEAKKGARLIYGFEHNMTAKKLSDAIESGTLDKHLHYVPVRKGDVFLIPAGTIHAICAGAVIAEIQENSNVTYRIYDYDRLDKNGNKRELHLDKAVEVLNLKADWRGRAKNRNVRYYPGCSREVLVNCPYFQTELVRVSGAFEFSVTDESFQVLLCTEGGGKIRNVGVKRPMSIKKGDCLFIPAGAGGFTVKGQAELLKVRC